MPKEKDKDEHQQYQRLINSGVSPWELEAYSPLDDLRLQPGEVFNMFGSWTPSQQTLDQLFIEHSIPFDFSLSVVPDFCSYWISDGQRRRSSHWEHTFMGHAKYRYNAFLDGCSF